MQADDAPSGADESPSNEGNGAGETLDLRAQGAQDAGQPAAPLGEAPGAPQPTVVPPQPNPEPPEDEAPSAQGHDTLDVSGRQAPRLELSNYIPEKKRDDVRLIVTVGLLLMFAWVIVWASIESASSKDHWDQTKDMLQIILPALTGLIGSVLGFYFGSGGASKTS